MKIALVGPSGTGKSTLARAFAAASQNSYDFVNVQTEDFMKSRGISSHSELGALTLEENAEFQRSLMRLRHEKFASHDRGVITDRSAIDAWVYFLCDNAKRLPEDLAAEFESEVSRFMLSFDAVLYLPFSGATYDSGQSRRIDNRRYHMLTDLVYESFLLSHLDPSRVHRVRRLDLGERVAQLMRISNQCLERGDRLPGPEVRGFSQRDLDAALDITL